MFYGQWNTYKTYTFIIDNGELTDSTRTIGKICVYIYDIAIAINNNGINDVYSVYLHNS